MSRKNYESVSTEASSECVISLFGERQVRGTVGMIIVDC